MSQFTNDIKQKFKQGDILTKLIFVNIGVFALVLVLTIILGLFSSANEGEIVQTIEHYISLPVNDFFGLITKPYTIITHMFSHTGFMHLAGNMLTLYFLGKLFLSYFTSKNLFGLYILGGLIGAIVLLIISTLSPKLEGMHSAIGASAAVIAIVVGICAYAPNTEVRPFGLFPLKLMWVGIILVGLDLLNMFKSNSGGHIAHLGGAMTGYTFALYHKKGIDITKGINSLINKLYSFIKREPKMKVVYSQEKVRKMSDDDYNSHRKATQVEIDKILDKISSSGYDSLTKREKEVLFNYSNKK